MQLLYSPNSPYARKCRVVVFEKKLESRVELTEVDVYAGTPALVAANPLGKVPALVLDDGTSLCDSPLICEYLNSVSSDVPLLPEDDKARLKVRALAALADGIMDAAVDMVLQARRTEEKRWPEWIERKTIAIRRTIDAIAHIDFAHDAM